MGVVEVCSSIFRESGGTGKGIGLVLFMLESCVWKGYC